MQTKKNKCKETYIMTITYMHIDEIGHHHTTTIVHFENKARKIVA